MALRDSLSLLLVFTLLAFLLGPLAASEEVTPFAPQVPGTDRQDLLVEPPRQWSVEEREDEPPGRYVLTGTTQDPRGGVIAARVYGDLATLEAVFLERDEDRLSPVFNTGAVLSTIRFDPPLTIQGEPGLQTVDIPRLPWSPPVWDNLSFVEPQTDEPHHITVLETRAVIPTPDNNGTSPPPGQVAPFSSSTEAQEGFTLTWRVTFSDRYLPAPGGGLSPAAIGFQWILEGPGGSALQEGQQVRWVFLFDYDAPRSVQRIDDLPLLDGAYLLQDDHRAALRLSRFHHPVLDEEAGDHNTLEPARTRLDVQAHRGGVDPTNQPALIAPPLVYQAQTNLTQDARGLSLAGEMVFFKAAPLPPARDGPDGPPLAAPLAPEAWQALLVVGLAVLVIVPRWRKHPATTP
jgi:hypothetical protein